MYSRWQFFGNKAFVPVAYIHIDKTGFKYFWQNSRKMAFVNSIHQRSVIEPFGMVTASAVVKPYAGKLFAIVNLIRKNNSYRCSRLH